jgi:predicted lysophospholipase L1 biosynthesis ABC-type transport system permease subunit
MNSEEKRRVYFTPQDAYRLGIGYIKRRLQRTSINIASIALANSFLTSLILTNMFYSTYNELKGGSIVIDANQYWLVAVALIVSVVGITNAMLISVYERYRDIGTMKCIGATDQHILMLFLIESIIQGAIGGIAGFLFGLFAAILSSGFTTGFDIILKIRAFNLLVYLLGTTTLSITLSIIASIYPAWRASILPPVEALRYEL